MKGILKCTKEYKRRKGMNKRKKTRKSTEENK